jgi:hypothetical protein
MKHASTVEVFDHWNERRSGRPAPERSDIEPGAIRRALGDTFMLALDPPGDHAFRLAGTRVCALFCRELKGTSFADLWDDDSRTQALALLAIASEETLGAVAGVTGQSDSGTIDLELLLLPILPSRWSEGRHLGVLAPMSTPYWLGQRPLATLALRHWRHLGPPPPALAFRRPSAATSRPERLRHGLVVHEGGRAT